MIVGGLDGATRSGLGIIDGDKLIHAESFRPAGKGDGEIFHGFRKWLREHLIAHRVDYLAIEQPLPTNLERTEIVFSQSDAFGRSQRKIKRPMSQMSTYLRLYGIRGIAFEVCEDVGIDYEEVNVRDWRAIMHGRRSAPKGQVDTSAWWKDQALARCRMLGWNVTSKDAAEGALIAEYLRLKLNPRLAAHANDLFRSKS